MKILVIDDHSLIRQALQNMLLQLDSRAEVLESADCSAALALAAYHLDLDLILLDLHLPGMGGMDALTHFRQSHPAVPVVVLSGNHERQTVLTAIDRGAMGFIPKSSSNAVMLNALRLVLSGGVYLPKEILEPTALPTTMPSRNGASQLGVAAKTPSDLGLTDRQIEVLTLLLQGKSNKLICRELDLAEGTVKIHVTAVLKALNVTNRTQAVIAASQWGWHFDILDRS
ncbi:MAG: response regulator transcription factor [Gammaproteobacteria bacterium]|nr:response regulator transcription factor [Gammaproteobacteria bacterium]